MNKIPMCEYESESMRSVTAGQCQHFCLTCSFDTIEFEECCVKLCKGNPGTLLSRKVVCSTQQQTSRFYSFDPPKSLQARQGQLVFVLTSFDSGQVVIGCTSSGAIFVLAGDVS